jgi:hypothetical protein
MRSTAERIGQVVSCLVAVWLIAYALLHFAHSLPLRYTAAHWRIAWVGFDLGLALAAAVTAVLIAWRSRYAALTAAVTAALFICDAWFDCLTANTADIKSSLLSLLGEIPGAIFFLWLATRLLGRK